MGRTRREPRIVVVGAGMAGIAVAVALREAGHQDFVLLEKGSDVGGVWHWNRYPGLTCDVPSNLYQYSFHPKPDWPRVWARGEQIREYHRDVVAAYGLEPHLRLETEVVSAVFREDSATYLVTDSHGTEHVADFLVMATGVLHHPRIPELPGLASFEGDLVHTARWDPAIETAGRRVAVLGSGSTGVQVVSALQPDAARLVHFSRTPQWVLWAPMDLPQPRALGALFRAAPGLNRLAYRVMLRGADSFTTATTAAGVQRRMIQRYARWSLRVQVRDRDLRARLTPADDPLCKRQVVSGRYYRAIQRPNAEVVTERIQEVGPRSITTADGTVHEVDVIVLATGFHAHEYMRPMDLRGRGGLTIDEAWAEGPRAYNMTAIPGFPNLFTVLGPNSPTGSISLQHSAERTAAYVLQWISRWAYGDLDTVEVTEEATDRFDAAVREALPETVWSSGCESWYLKEDGAVDLWPFDRTTLERALAGPRDEDFVVTAGVRA